MTDFVLRADDRETMYAAYAAIGILEEGKPLRSVGILPDGTDWAMVDFGPRSVIVGYQMEGPPGEEQNMGPIFETDGYYCVLRWRSELPTPPEQPGVMIVWRSDVDAPDAYPDGVVRFAE
jgi:hypothetical protein